MVDVTVAARAATARPDAVVAQWAATPAPHRPDNMTTAGLDLARGTLADGTTFTVFAKTLHPASASPVWSLIPADARPEVLVELDWLDAPGAYRSALHDDRPAGLRMPRLWHVVQTEQQIQLWLEPIEDRGVWDADAYHRSAKALGQLSGRWPATRRHHRARIQTSRPGVPVVRQDDLDPRHVRTTRPEVDILIVGV